MVLRIEEQFSLGKDEYLVYDGDQLVYRVANKFAAFLDNPFTIVDMNEEPVLIVDPGSSGSRSKLWYIYNPEKEKIAEVSFDLKGRKLAELKFGWTEEKNLITIGDKYYSTKTTGSTTTVMGYKSSNYKLELIDRETKQPVAVISRDHDSKKDLLQQKDVLFVEDFGCPLPLFPLAMGIIVDQKNFERDDKDMEEGLLGKFFKFLGKFIK